MPGWSVTRTIAAPVDVVLRTVADVTQFSQAVPNVVKVEAPGVSSEVMAPSTCTGDGS